MYTHEKISNCLKGLIGFEQTYDEDIELIDNDLQNSLSGLYVNNLHPLLNYENILSTALHFEKIGVRAWNSAASYKKGNIVKSGAKIYQAIQDNIDKAITEAAFWVETTLLSAYLRKMYNQSTLNLVKSIFTKKKLNELGKSLIESVQLYEGVGNLSGRISKNNRLVGFKIKLDKKHTIARLNQIGLQLDTVQNGVKIYLFHSDNPSPIKTFEVNHEKSLVFDWYDANSTILDNSMGFYYLVYRENEIIGSTVKKKMDFSLRSGCGTCSQAARNAQLFDKWSKYISIQPFYVDHYGEGEENILWDDSDEILVSDNNWGMNLRIAVECDVSDTLCASKRVLIDALSEQLVFDFLKEMSFSLRDNQAQGKIAGLAAAVIANTDNGRPGEQQVKLTEAIDAVSFDFSNMNSICLPCTNKGGFSSIYR